MEYGACVPEQDYLALGLAPELRMQCEGGADTLSLFLQRSGHKLGVKAVNTCASKQLLFPLLNILWWPEVLPLVNQGI